LKTFSYVASDINGKIVKGREFAEDYRDLTEKLKAKNLFLTKYRDIEEQKAPDVKYKFKTKDLAFISRQLSSMLSAGLTLVRALQILHTQQENKKAKQILLDIYEDVQKGKSFSQALSERPGVFPGLFISMVNAGETAGSLDTIMLRLADHYAKEHKINNKIKSSMTYPIILSILSVCIVIALFVFVMPTFKSMMSGDIPALSAFVMGISDFLIDKWPIILVVLVILIVSIKVMLKVDAVRLKFDRFKLRIPKAGKLIGTIYTGRFSRTMSNLYASGIPMVDCIEKSVSTLNNAYISSEFATVIENVKQGESLSTAIARTGIFDSLFTSIVYVGEESGTLDSILEKTADYYEEESETAIGKLVSMIEPLLIIFLGIGIGIVLVGLYPMIFSSYNAIA